MYFLQNNYNYFSNYNNIMTTKFILSYIIGTIPSSIGTLTKVSNLMIWGNLLNGNTFVINIMHAIMCSVCSY